MALLKCPECNHDVSSEATSCPNCGYPINKNVENHAFPAPIDDAWLEKYKKKPFNSKLTQVVFTVISIILFVIFMCLIFKEPLYGSPYEFNAKKIAFIVLAWFTGFISLIAIIFSIVAFFLVKTKIVNIDGYNIAAYLGFFKYILIIEDQVIESFFISSFHSTDVFAKLPNGKSITARFSTGTVSIRKENE